MKIIVSQKIKKDKNDLSNINNIYNNISGDITQDVIPEELGTILYVTPDNVYDFLEDNYENDPEEKIREDRIKDDLDIGVDFYEEPPLEISDEELPEFASTQEAMNWAKNNNRTVRINYITKKRNDIARIIEPHGQFSAKNGNVILVTYDQTIGGIRAFIIDNIINFVISKDNFEPKFNVLENKGIKAMNNQIFMDLKSIGDNLDSLKMAFDAKEITNIMTNCLNIKTAQYVGIQGYWIRNKRCFDNCYRQKRAENKGKTAQDVWFECHKEYEASINDDKSGWEKYAGNEQNIKIASKEEQEVFNIEKDFFNKSIKEMTRNDIPFENAVYASIDKGFNRYGEIAFKDSIRLLDIAYNLEQKGHIELSKKVADVSYNIVKETQVWDAMKNVGRGIADVGRGMARDVGGMLGRGYEKAKGKVQQYGQEGDLTRTNARINQLIA
ncbi:hypothetical protein LCGC14_2188640, partial [marine sediment metagenome]